MKLELKEGEEICPECNGTGEREPKRKGALNYCRKCHGHGKLDWIEMVVGKNGGYVIKPGVYVTEVDFSYHVPLSYLEGVDEFRKSIIENLGIPKKYLGIKE